MKLKLDCQCGTRFAFEFEPVNGRVPGEVKCPSCGHDGTTFTNFMLQQMAARGELITSPEPAPAPAAPAVAPAPPPVSPPPAPVPAANPPPPPPGLKITVTKPSSVSAGPPPPPKPAIAPTAHSHAGATPEPATPPPSPTVQTRISIGAAPPGTPEPKPDEATAAKPGLSLSRPHTPAPAAPAAPATPAAPAATAPSAESAPAAKPGLSISRSHPPAPPPPPPAASKPPPPPPGMVPATVAGTTPPADASKVVPMPVPGTPGGVGNDPNAPRCAKHGSEPSTGECFVCKAPICMKCMQLFGYLCSAGCRHAAEKHQLKVPVCPHQKAVADSAEWSKFGRVAAAIAAVLVIFVSFMAWYYFVGSQPRLYYSVKTAEEMPIHYAHLLDKEHLLVVDAKSMTLHDLKKQKVVWTTPVEAGGVDEMAEEPEEEPEPEAKPAVPKGRAGSAGQAAMQESLKQASAVSGKEEIKFRFRPRWYGGGPRVHLRADEIWVCFDKKLERFDLKTGQSKQVIPLQGQRASFTPAENDLLVVTMPTQRSRLLTRVTLPEGKVETTFVSLGPSEKILVSQDPVPVQPTAGALLKQELEEQEKEYREKLARNFYTAGTSLVEFETKMLESKKVSVQTVKPDDGKSHLNSKLSASSNVGAVAQDIMNDIKRSNGDNYRIDDVSTYQVTLRRIEGADVVEWSRQMTGPPRFYSFKTVDLVVAGKTAVLLDRKNKVITETKLNYDVRGSYGLFDDADEHQHSPGLELGDQLFLFDQGVLTAFDLPSGEIKWRLTTVGISRIVPDGRGALYVSSTTASPESIQYSDQANFTDRPRAVILKVQASTGKILWQAENRGQAEHYQNKLLFTSETIQGGGLMSLGKMTPSDHYRIYRLNPSNGKDEFEFYHKGRPAAVGFEDRRILMRFPNEVKVLKFMAL